MLFQRLRRTVLLIASLALVAACGGGGKIADPFVPARGVLLDGAGNSWAQVVLGSYGGSISAVAPTGGVNYSLGSTPIGAGLGSPTLAQRVDTALQGGLQASDLVVLSGGIPDIVAQANGAQSTAAVAAAGQAMADQVARLVGGGATRVLVANAYDVGLTPQFRGTGLQATATALTRAFNDSLKVSLRDGDRVFLVDTERYINAVIAAGGSGYNLTNVTASACAGSTAGVGVVSSATCTTGAFGANNPSVFLFYDPLYLTPAGQSLFGSEAARQLRDRW